MLKRLTLLIASAASLAGLGATAALADGMPLKTAYAAPGRCNGPFSGFYFGPHIGYGSYTTTWQEHSTDTGQIVENNFFDRNWVVGGQVGYNCQTGMAVFGIESDFAWSRLNAKQTFVSNLDTVPPETDIDKYTSTVSWLGTTRLRAGLASDGLLVFVTSGLAYAKIKHSLHDDVVEGVLNSESSTRWGWTVGAGTEYMLSDRMTFKADVLYVDFGQKNIFTQTANPNEPEFFRARDTLWVARVGLNFKLGGDRHEEVPLK